MIGLLLALALVVGCPVGVAHERAHAVAVCIEARVGNRPHVVHLHERSVTLVPRRSRPLPVVRPRALDLRHGGLPQPRAPDRFAASQLLG